MSIQVWHDVDLALGAVKDGETLRDGMVTLRFKELLRTVSWRPLGEGQFALVLPSLDGDAVCVVVPQEAITFVTGFGPDGSDG